MEVDLIKFTLKEMENTYYKTINLNEHFKLIEDFNEDEESLLEYYNFQLLLKQDNRMLFAIRNNYRADVYILDLDSLKCYSFGSLGAQNILEGRSLSIRGINMDKIDFVYELDDERNLNGLYSLLEKEIVYKFETSKEYEYLYLTDRYYLISKDSFYYDDEKEEWIFNYEEDELYLYDRAEDERFEIFDERLKDTYHTPSNHFIYNDKDEVYFLNYPFMMDPEDGEALLKGPKKDQLLNGPKEISFILLEEFIENVKLNKNIKLKTLYSWDSPSIIKPYSYVEYELRSLDFSIYDLKNKVIKVLSPKLSQGKVELQLISKASYSHLKTCRNLHYMDRGVIVAHRDNKTEILAPIRKIIKNSNRESVIDFSGDGYLINAWSEDEDGRNYSEYMIIKDLDGKEIARLDGYHLKLEKSNILIKI